MYAKLSVFPIPWRCNKGRFSKKICSRQFCFCYEPQIIWNVYKITCIGLNFDIFCWKLFIFTIKSIISACRKIYCLAPCSHITDYFWCLLISNMNFYKDTPTPIDDFEIHSKSLNSSYFHRIWFYYHWSHKYVVLKKV